ncbi:MAG: 50S ribosomal protein L3 [Deltaproteobacteria bacterium]|nr:50S ribosomal protein L3 [Candidatus Anaeroferrophillus wilburensis]MBN2889520.1 50S ribosomal protein L3 [Deltaproteobacteria bacterium]
MAQIKGLLGKKIGMTQIFNELGEEIPVTVVKVGPCTVVQIKRDAKDGYNAVQLGFDEKKLQLAIKPEIGHCAKAGKGVFRTLKEVKVDNPDDYQVGDQLSAEMFATGDLVHISGTSKGKGFAGVMKRWGFRGAGASHGVHKVHRSGGSVGTSAWPARVWKGKKMAGMLGDQTVTMKNLTVIGVRPEQGLLLIKGGVPGSKNGVLFIKKVQ